ncbi:MAG: B12-binding domain-containing radical SAM protein [Candidatus Riflebacteria bacterium]|nr:B12-binding domain-containing radical SAM protein [Candidatus Riflebacteria bacterium]
MLNLITQLYNLKDSDFGLRLQKSQLAHRLFDEFGRGFLLPILGIPVDLDVRIALGGNKCEPILKTMRPLEKGQFCLLLIQPPLPDNQRQKRLVPIGLACLAAFLREKLEKTNFNIGILDSQSQNLSIAKTLEIATKWPWNMVGISFMTSQADIAKNLAKALKKNLRGVELIAGGNHPSADPESVSSSFDYIVLSEGEETLLEIVRKRMQGESVDEVMGLALLNTDGKLVRNPDRPFIENLDSLPDMAWDLLPVESYDWPLHVVGGKRLPVMASRGCPYGCSFCGSPGHWRRKVRYRSPRRVFLEIQNLQRIYKTDYFHFKDDNFGINAVFVKELCEMILEANLGITWICTDRAAHVIRNRELLPLMRKAGCIGIEIGIESADPEAYASVNKEQELDEALQAIKLQKENEMVPQYTYMVFAPGETLATYYFQKTLFDQIHDGDAPPKFFQPLPFKLYIGQFATAYPNTGFHRDRKSLGLDLLHDHDLAHHFNITFLPFSLLNDIPYWTVEKLEERDFEQFGIAVWQAFYAQFPGRLPNRRLAMRIWDMLQGLASFFRSCDGSRTLEKAAGYVADELNWSGDKALRICSLAAYLFAQQGMVRSAINGLKQNYVIRRVRVPDFKRRIIQLLAWWYMPLSLKKLADS